MQTWHEIILIQRLKTFEPKKPSNFQQNDSINRQNANLILQLHTECKNILPNVRYSYSSSVILTAHHFFIIDLPFLPSFPHCSKACGWWDHHKGLTVPSTWPLSCSELLPQTDKGKSVMIIHRRYHC